MNRRQFNLTAFARVCGVVAGVAAGAAGSLYAPAAQADTWPSKPVTVIVPFPAGGGTDAFARPLTAQLSKQLGKQFVIDNRGGAGGTLGASLAAKAAPDGYTIFIGGAHHAIAPSFYKKLDYDIEKDFVPITVIAQPPQVIVVNPAKVQANTLKELIALVKANPGKLNYGSAGNGSAHHLAGELFKLQTQTFITHIPYKGAGPALSDLIAGQVDMMFDGLGSSAQHIRANRIKALAVASKTRSAAFPNVPTAAEAGVPNYEVSTWYALWAPKGTPKEVVDKLYAETTKALNSPEMKQIWLQNGSDTPAFTPDQFAQFQHAEIKRWADVVQRSGAKID
ncbi:Tripartite-type tricarboxylate transporter, receptor component TctC [Cupriavidus sp. YR651]|uniref:Bug family tripartite tricarboxylate transporter substrate binding protein n=1 Tax=Cupriavidus sp. YR651 TaxID=1855315 RepID=UPI00088886AA|nr:tripartite tricarboxylate transporter substrate binding protein [Cupriavidus sp. YR651]SDC24186.1 Tripartite-type tricarboxylate transporter, receptor component TctC [Cupriavidus sp. YR651]